MNRVLLIWWTLTLLLSPAADAQPPAVRLASGFAGAHRTPAEESPDDPGYAAYREGYAKVLNEEWEAARKIFEDLRSRHPRSRYVDDAQYWAAYALMHTDRARAADAYRTFIRQNPRSRYVDDAVADLAELQPGDLRIILPPNRFGDAPRAPEALEKEDFAIQAALAKQERLLKHQQEELRRYMFIAPHAVVKPRLPDTEALRPEVKVKIEALRALAHSAQDPAAFDKLRSIATDASQPEPVREVALMSAARFPQPQALSFLATVAKSDTNRELQVLAVDLIGEHRTAKNERVATLIDLYGDVPDDRREQRMAIFYSIAGIGNDRAVDFLKTVAVSDGDYELRREAVFYLGGIGTERARTALFEVLQEY